MRKQDNCIRRNNRVKSIFLGDENLPTERHHNDPNIMLLALIIFLIIGRQHGSIKIGCFPTVVKFWKAIIFNFWSGYFFLQLLEEILPRVLLTSVIVVIVIVVILLLERIILKSCVFVAFISFFSFFNYISSICTVILCESIAGVVIFIVSRLWLILKIQYEEVFTWVFIIALPAFLYLFVSTRRLSILVVFWIISMFGIL